jgi:hypothetical protein
MGGERIGMFREAKGKGREMGKRITNNKIKRGNNLDKKLVKRREEKKGNK